MWTFRRVQVFHAFGRKSSGIASKSKIQLHMTEIFTFAGYFPSFVSASIR